MIISATAISMPQADDPVIRGLLSFWRNYLHNHEVAEELRLVATPFHNSSLAV